MREDNEHGLKRVQRLGRITQQYPWPTALHPLTLTPRPPQVTMHFNMWEPAHEFSDSNPRGASGKVTGPTLLIEGWLTDFTMPVRELDDADEREKKQRERLGDDFYHDYYGYGSRSMPGAPGVAGKRSDEIRDLGLPGIGWED